MFERYCRRAAIAIVALLAASLLPMAGAADPIDPLQRTWMRTDQPVAGGQATRTWMWGPQQAAFATEEAYVESQDGERAVVYYDKARMEVTDPNSDPNSVWHVTNGLLVVELMTGRVQLGDDTFEDLAPAAVNVAGDPDDPTGPTYATFAGLRTAPAATNSAPIIQRVARDGTVTTDGDLAGRGVTAAHRVQVPGIDHQVASVFWAFMHSEGVVWEAGAYTDAPLFENPFYATGYPVTEAYWATVAVGGAPRDVLTQCFERRCLTWTPDNPAGWQVEAGNVGLHYYRWRYGSERPAAPVVSVVFNIFVDGVQAGQTITQETFLGDTAVGTWTTVGPDGAELSRGTLIASHTFGTVEAAIVQDSPFTGSATLLFEYGFSLSGVGGDGTLTWHADLPTGPASGSVSFTASSTTLNVWDIELDELPPVLFTGDD